MNYLTTLINAALDGNTRMKRIFDCFVNLLVKKKQKEWSEIDAY